MSKRNALDDIFDYTNMSECDVIKVFEDQGEIFIWGYKDGESWEIISFHETERPFDTDVFNPDELAPR